jgi:hypothetical protein
MTAGKVTVALLGAIAVASANTTMENPVINHSLSRRIDEPILQIRSLTNGGGRRSSVDGAGQRNKSLAVARISLHYIDRLSRPRSRTAPSPHAGDRST